MRLKSVIERLMVISLSGPYFMIFLHRECTPWFRNGYSLILANPPFKGNLEADIVSTDLQKICKTKKTELLFPALFVRLLKIGGRCTCIVPDGVALWVF